MKVCTRYNLVPGYGYTQSLIVKLFIVESSLENVLGYRKFGCWGVLFSFLGCGFGSVHNQVLTCRIGRVTIWIDTTRVLTTFLNNFGSFIKLSYILVISV